MGGFLGGKYVKEHLFTTYSCNFSVILCVDYTDERISNRRSEDVKLNL